MAKPSYKAPDITQFLEDLAGRTTAINANKCVQPPFGCGGPALAFRDASSANEYVISGLCQRCQDEVFGGDD